MNLRALATFAATLLLCACSDPPPPPADTMIVKTLVAGQSESAATRSFSGAVHARYEMPLSFRIGGKLLERRVDAGAHVGAGDLLARLDPADVALQAAQAQSQLTLAEADARRYRDLRAKNFISAAALDAKETALKTAQSQAGLAGNQAGYARLSADRPGIVAAVLAEPGQVVAAGQPVMRLAQDGEREVAIDLPESVISSIQVGDVATVSLWAGGKDYHAKVREITPVADAATRTFATRVSLLDADAAVALGMTATVRFAAPGQPRLAIPLAAVFQQSDQPAVWVVGKDSTVSLRPIAVLAYADAGVVVGKGIEPGERIVAAGVHKLAAGQKVRVAP
jgi:membrane fusion protein, multidrug efflux system